ncbi:hypothetical protein WR25_04477 [Diploscapter pachys]|uniref:Uncharacterized protein n=1 Tax=Diploscapter pachys TaxID=2018661 RepID=A0A2A2LFX0_9BILA|nr:hypothetical protein WR25_04477 [Diploscapter pachys]
MATIGIDLGTTFSCVAIVGPQNEPEPIPNNFGNRITPSVVAYDPKNPSVLIGETAQNSAVLPINVIYDAKRMIGRQFNDKSVQDDKQLWPFEVVEKEGKPHVKLTHNGNERLISPEEVSSSVLKEMKAIAEHYLSKSITGAVITVPAYFNHRQRAETMKAAELAGLRVLRLINEPTAAAIAYGQKDNLDGKTVMIYDLGGGTFDVSIVKGEARSLQVISIAGHNHLGGQDFDQLIMKYVIEKYKEEKKKDCPTSKPKLMNRLRKACLESKHTLSHREQPAQIHIENVTEDEDFNCELSRKKLNELIGPMLKGSLDVVDAALKHAKLNEQNIDYVLLIGGSTRIPMVQELLAGKFGKPKLRYRINPDEAVALGASLLADDLEKYPDIEDNPNKGRAFQNDIGIASSPRERHNYTCNIRDIIPLSIGLGLRGGKFLRVIERFKEYPCKFEESLSTAYDNQSGSFSGIYEGESANTDNNIKFGEVTFEIDINGILNVTKEEVETGKKAEIKMKYDGKAHSEDDIEKIVEEAKRHEKEDREFLDLIAKREWFEDQIYDIKWNLENQPGKEEAMKLIREYLNWSDKLPPNIAEYDPKLEEFNMEISQHF